MQVTGVDPQILTRLQTLVDSGRVPHAMVLDGGTKDTRLSLAQTIAEALLCTASTGKPCGVCNPCKKVSSGIHPDVIHIVPDAGRKTLSVDRIRAMREDAYVLPNESDHKVYIIDQAELLQDYAQNALLKILEEPPAYATFILCTPSKASLLETVLSRTAVFSLSMEGEDPSSEALDPKVTEGATDLARALMTGREQELLSAVSVFEKSYDLLPDALEQFRLILRDALVCRAGGTTVLSVVPKAAKPLAEKFTEERLLAMERAAGEIDACIQRHANKNLTLTRLCSLLAAAAWG